MMVAWQIISLVYGGDFNLFRTPNVRIDDDDYELKILMRQFRFFGPFPGKYEQIVDLETVQVILYLMQEISAKDLTHFRRMTQREVAKEDNAFVCKTMQMDPQGQAVSTRIVARRMVSRKMMAKSFEACWQSLSF